MRIDEEKKNEPCQISAGCKLILSAAGEGIYGLDLNGHTTFCNPQRLK